VKASEQFTLDQGGQFQLLKEGEVKFALTCTLGHQWETGFKSKQVRKWCVRCKDIGKANKKRYFQDLDRRNLQQLYEEQDQLLRSAQAFQVLSSNAEDFAPDASLLQLFSQDVSKIELTQILTEAHEDQIKEFL